HRPEGDDVGGGAGTDQPDAGVVAKVAAKLGVGGTARRIIAVPVDVAVVGRTDGGQDGGVDSRCVVADQVAAGRAGGHGRRPSQAESRASTTRSAAWPSQPSMVAG